MGTTTAQCQPKSSRINCFVLCYKFYVYNTMYQPLNLKPRDSNGVLHLHKRPINISFVYQVLIDSLHTENTGAPIHSRHVGMVHQITYITYIHLGYGHTISLLRISIWLHVSEPTGMQFRHKALCINHGISKPHINCKLHIREYRVPGCQGCPALRVLRYAICQNVHNVSYWWKSSSVLHSTICFCFGKIFQIKWKACPRYTTLSKKLKIHTCKRDNIL